MMKTKIKLLGLTLLLSYPLFAQITPPLNIGDTVPNIVFENVINWPGGKIRLTDLRGKLVIIDYWNIACPPCIAAFPKMQKLQEKFGDQIQILLVNGLNALQEVEKQYGSFPGKHPSSYIRNTHLPFVFNSVTKSGKSYNTKIDTLFDHSAEPYHVWIDQKGIVRATSREFGTTEQQIRNFLAGKDIQLIKSNRLDDVYDYYTKQYKSDGRGRPVFLPGSKKSLLRKENGWILDKIQYSSAFLSGLFIKGVGSGYIIDSATNKTIGFRRECSDLDHFRSAYVFGELNFDPNLIILNVRNKDKFIEPGDPEHLDSWYQENQHFYELRLPASRLSGDKKKDDSLFKKIWQKDLERFLGIKGHYEKRKMKCLLLVRTAQGKLKTSGGTTNFEIHPYEYIAQNYPLRGFISDFQSRNNNPGDPIIINGYMEPYLYDIDAKGNWQQSERNYLDYLNVDLHLKCSLKDVARLKKELHRYGLDLIEVERELQVLVLEDSEDF